MVNSGDLRASEERPNAGLEVSFAWDLYGLAIIAVIAAIAVWEAIKWFFEWLSLRRSGSVEEARGARRLRRLQQAVQEEVSRYGLEEPAPPPLQSRVRTRDVVIPNRSSAGTSAGPTNKTTLISGSKGPL